jgi:F-type H+-transporting ATPase subunit epsilon
MADGIQIEIVSPERLVLAEQARSVTIPGTEGYFTVMGEHAPLMTVLKPGFITVTDIGGVAHTFYVEGGFADVSPDGLTILADKASPASEFDRSKIEADIVSAEAAVAAAVTLEDKGRAQELLDGWRNLLLEADQVTRALAH